MSESFRLTYPPELPITSRKQEIIESIKNNQVLIIAGETGSGKTTQIPKLCLEAGRGRRGKIGCTQPRRIAAMSIAQRIAEEMGEKTGETVGYKIRFSDETGQQTKIKLMTDGILLAEVQKDRLLGAYDTLIIDEAHERSLNIDFILGLLREILRKRRDLHVIITSATIDTEKFAKAFDGAPIIEVSGRTYPVDIHYAEIQDKGENDSYVDAAVREARNICTGHPHGDILIFMPSEQDIRETCESLAGEDLVSTEVMPLYARMPSSSQNRIFAPFQGRKIIVATNIAETSITIPGIRYVIDTGLARIASYSPASRTNSLPISPVSRSSADQRAGRCGRVSDGVCVRLYSREDYQSRDRFTLPEILRSNLAEVLLRMIAIQVKNIEHFPFIDPPKQRAVRDGLNLLLELGAIKEKKDRRGKKHFILTKTGRFMAFLPLDPRISRILIEGKYQHCIREMTILAAVLSIQDPKERPMDKQKEADAAHAVFTDESSDLITLLNIWNAYHSEWREQRSKSKMRKFCEKNYISYRRMREWRDIHLQITSVLKEQGYRLESTPLSTQPDKKKGFSPFYQGIHLSFLAGYLSNIAQHKEKQFYTAAKNRECMIFPGSGVFKNPPEWIACTELIRTSRLFARNLAAIRPEWISRLAGNIRKYIYSSPAWSFSREEVTAMRQTKVYGLIVEGRKEVGYGEIDPVESSFIFNSQVLVEHAERYSGSFPFLGHNLKIIAQIKSIENRLRRRDIYTGDQSLLEFYNSRINNVFSIQGLKKYLREKGDKDLYIEKENFMLYNPDKSELQKYPDRGRLGEKEYSLMYSYSPEDSSDGVTVIIEEKDAVSVDASMVDWLIPGLLKEKVRLLLKGLPKEYRRELVPVNRSADYLSSMLPKDPEEPLITTLSRLIYNEFDTHVPPEAWSPEDLPEYLKPSFEIRSAAGKKIKRTKEPEKLKAAAAAPRGQELSSLIKKYGIKASRIWEYGTIPQTVTGASGKIYYPGLHETVDGIELTIFSDRMKAEKEHRNGIAELAAVNMKDILAVFKDEVLPGKKVSSIALYFDGFKNLNRGIWKEMIKNTLGALVYSKASFETYIMEVREHIYDDMNRMGRLYEEIILTYYEVRQSIIDIEETFSGMAGKEAYLEERLKELRTLIPENFYRCYSLERLKDIKRYALAIRRRSEKGVNDIAKDKENENLLNSYYDWYSKTMETLPPYSSGEKREELNSFYWLLQELKIQIFAQEIGTAVKVSPKRLNRKIEKIEMMK